MSKKHPNSFNDKMVQRTVIPAIYLWLLASGAVVGMGIWKPDVVLANLDGFIALIAIIGGVAGPAMNTVLRMWESEQTIEIDNIPQDLSTSVSVIRKNMNTRCFWKNMHKNMCMKSKSIVSVCL